MNNVNTYPYAIDKEKDTSVSPLRLTPEQVARSESMKSFANQGYLNNALAGNTNASGPRERTPEEQFKYERNLKYRTIYRIRRANRIIAESKEELRDLNKSGSDSYDDKKRIIKLNRKILTAMHTLNLCDKLLDKDK